MYQLIRPCIFTIYCAQRYNCLAKNILYERVDSIIHDYLSNFVGVSQMQMLIFCLH